MSSLFVSIVVSAWPRTELRWFSLAEITLHTSSEILVLSCSIQLLNIRLAFMYILSECVFTISYVHKSKLVSCVMQMFYTLAKFHLLELSIIEEICWNFPLYWCVHDPSCRVRSPLLLYTFWGWACLSLWFSVSSSLLTSGDLFCQLNRGFCKKFIMKDFSKYLIYHVMICLSESSVPQLKTELLVAAFSGLNEYLAKASSLARQGPLIKRAEGS